MVKYDCDVRATVPYMPIVLLITFHNNRYLTYLNHETVNGLRIKENYGYGNANWVVVCFSYIMGYIFVNDFLLY